MPDIYHIFGLNVCSAIPLPAQSAMRSEAGITPDVVIKFGEAPLELADPRISGVRYQAGPGEFLLRIDDVARYHVRDGRSITIAAQDGAGDDEILLFLMGPAVGALLHQRGLLVLHGGAIAVNGKSVIFSGPTHSGKSTLTAGLHRRGYTFLSDDLCAIAVTSGAPAVIPGFPRLKLWADVLPRLDTDKIGLQSVRESRKVDKYFLPVDSNNMEPVPVKSIFALEPSDTDRIEITALKGADKIVPLIANTYTYSLRFLQGQGAGGGHFEQCAAVAAKTTVCRVTRPVNGFFLDELMDTLQASFAS